MLFPFSEKAFQIFFNNSKYMQGDADAIQTDVEKIDDFRQKCFS